MYWTEHTTGRVAANWAKVDTGRSSVPSSKLPDVATTTRAPMSDLAGKCAVLRTTCSFTSLDEQSAACSAIACKLATYPPRIATRPGRDRGHQWLGTLWVILRLLGYRWKPLRSPPDDRQPAWEPKVGTTAGQDETGGTPQLIRQYVDARRAAL